MEDSVRTVLEDCIKTYRTQVRLLVSASLVVLGVCLAFASGPKVGDLIRAKDTLTQLLDAQRDVNSEIAAFRRRQGLEKLRNYIGQLNEAVTTLTTIGSDIRKHNESIKSTDADTLAREVIDLAVSVGNLRTELYVLHTRLTSNGILNAREWEKLTQFSQPQDLGKRIASVDSLTWVTPRDTVPTETLTRIRAFRVVDLREAIGDIEKGSLHIIFGKQLSTFDSREACTQALRALEAVGSDAHGQQCRDDAPNISTMQTLLTRISAEIDERLQKTIPVASGLPASTSITTIILLAPPIIALLTHSMLATLASICHEVSLFRSYMKLQPDQDIPFLLVNGGFTLRSLPPGELKPWERPILVIDILMRWGCFLLPVGAASAAVLSYHVLSGVLPKVQFETVLLVGSIVSFGIVIYETASTIRLYRMLSNQGKIATVSSVD